MERDELTKEVNRRISEMVEKRAMKLASEEIDKRLKIAMTLFNETIANMKALIKEIKKTNREMSKLSKALGIVKEKKKRREEAPKTYVT